MNVKIFADGADLKVIEELVNNPFVRGFTCNPTLMRKAGITDYKKFAQEAIQLVSPLPISLEVFKDDPMQIMYQAQEISTWGMNVYVKIPVTNTKKQEMYSVIKILSDQGIKVNVTAVTTLDQVLDCTKALKNSMGGYISVFAGRIADTGRDPVPRMLEAVNIIDDGNKDIELIWASPRELLNVVQADEIGVDIITVTKDILDKLYLIGKNLEEYSLDTVKMFYKDATESGFKL
jgi:transaldolase